MDGDRIAWHPGFASAMQLELGAYRDSLTFETEHELNRQPLRIDLLVVKKNAGVRIEHDVGSIFRGHNIMEFKSERDSLSIDDMIKAIAYGCLYKAYGPHLDAIGLDDVTITLVRHGRPVGLFKRLASYGCEVHLRVPGVYDIGGLIFAVQVVVTSELEQTDHVWLASLASGLETIQLRALVRAAGFLENQGEQRLADAVLDVVARANSDALERLKEEDEMGKSLYEIMKPEIDEAIAKARVEAIREGHAEGRAEGLTEGRAEGLAEGRAEGLTEGLAEGRAEGLTKGRAEGLTKGRAEAIRAMVGRLLNRGGFSNEEIADLAGTSVEEVCSIASNMGLSLS